LDLPALLVTVLLELRRSADVEMLALLHRLREGGYTARDVSDLADIIERLAAQPRAVLSQELCEAAASAGPLALD
jgi:hypothetical protein